MPTREHNGLVEMFRANPSLAPHFLESLFHREVPSHTKVTVGESVLDQMLPIEFRADLVLELCDANEAVVTAVALEVQRDQDPDKKFVWPVYAAVLRAKKRCPALVLVIALDPEVARWASEPIETGMGTFRPLVLGPAVVPVVTDRSLAERETELAILSAMVHGNGPNGLEVVTTAFDALRALDAEHAAVYFQMVCDILLEPMIKALEVLVMERMMSEKAKFPPFAQALIDRGVLEGLRDGKIEGLRDGKIEGLRDGKIEGLRSALYRGFARRGISLMDEERTRVEACTDLATLDSWLDRVFDAKTASDIFS